MKQRVALVLSLTSIGTGALAKSASILQAAHKELTSAFDALAQPAPDPDKPPIGRWDLTVTPPFPTKHGAVVYAYATRFDPQLHDGIRVARVWAEAQLATDGAVTVKPLTKLSELGKQGVYAARGLTSSEDRETAYAWSLAGGKGTTPASVATTYCFWARGNGVILATLPASARGFITKLHCPTK